MYSEAQLRKQVLKITTKMKDLQEEVKHLRKENAQLRKER
jgi:hypothetical protein